MSDLGCTERSRKKIFMREKKISSLFQQLTVRQFIDFLKRMKSLLAKDTVVTCRQESETPFVLRSDEGLTLATSAFFLNLFLGGNLILFNLFDTKFS